MEKIAILEFLSGSFQSGFEVSLVIQENRGQLLSDFKGKLPASNIEQLYQSWQESFYHLTGSYRNHKDWDIDSSIATNISHAELVTECWQKVQQLEENMQLWLQSSADLSWQKIREKLAQEIAINPNNIQLVIKTKYIKIWKLPWHVWDLLLEYPNVGISYSLNEYSQINLVSKTHKTKKARILAIFGDSQNIDLKEDCEAIQHLPNTEIVFLNQPNSRELIQELRCDRGWDIFFFAGHSRTETDSRIYIREEESLTIEQFQNTLREAISNGLKIAIFNSCDGLGLAKKLVAKLSLPAVIVMQEIVPDIVAQSFLKEFLIKYQSGHSIFTAVRHAQERLEEFAKIPGATWLPLIVQNFSVIPPKWFDLVPVTSSDKYSQNNRETSQNKIVRLIFSSFTITTLVMVVRWFGILQPLELYAYDRLVRLRSGEPKPEPRILVITIDNSDIEYQEKENLKEKNALQSLSDRTLNKLLDKLEILNPTTIGLDIYRPDGFEPTVMNRLQSKNNFFAICKTNTDGISPPQELSSHYWGFSDILLDNDRVARRHLLTMTPDATDSCNTNYSLSFLLALHYLTVRENINLKLTPEGTLQIDPLVFEKNSNKAIFNRLKNHSSGYQSIDDRGVQILLNYRYYSSFREAIYHIPLRQVLTEEIPSSLKGKLQQPIILIGTTAEGENYDDFFMTPYGMEIPGVFLQAQMVSQILSKVLDNRPLIWQWQWWLEAIWIWAWSIIGGLLAAVDFNRWRLSVSILISLLGIFSICLVVFNYSGWIPLIPAFLGFLSTIILLQKTKI